MSKAKASGTTKLGYEDFFVKAINALRGEYKGVHPVISGLNSAFRTYYGEGHDPVVESRKLAEAGKLTIIPCHKGKKGVMLYVGRLEGKNNGEAVLSKILG